MKILVLYTSLTDYWVSCMRYDHLLTNNQYLVFRQTPNPNAPFKLESEEGIEIFNENAYTNQQLQEEVKKFKPDIIYIAGWGNRKYLSIAKIFKQRGIPTITGLDNQWKGNLRQRIGVLLSPYKVKKFFSHVWIAGMAQYEFARQLGFPAENILNNLYSCDLTKFNNSKPLLNRRFVFLGRLVDHKGVDILIKAFEQFKEKNSNEWILHVIGNGEYAERLKGIKGIVHQSFIQPQDVPAELHKGGVFVLPSRYEAWGVVIHEAAASGMPIITTTSCGSARHLVQNGYNGFVIPPNSVKSLTAAMLKTSTIPDEKLIDMGLKSHSLAQSINPEIWSAQINSILEVL